MNADKLADEIFYILDEWYKSKTREIIRPAQTSKIQIKTTGKIFVLTVEETKKL